jgi:hypothetical protein
MAQSTPIAIFGRSAWNATTALHHTTSDLRTVEAQLRGHNLTDALEVAHAAAKHATDLVAALEALTMLSLVLDLEDPAVADAARERITTAFND